jgi:site-specific recombinase XerC
VRGGRRKDERGYGNVESSHRTRPSHIPTAIIGIHTDDDDGLNLSGPENCLDNGVHLKVTTPKGGRLRRIPLTVRLATALREHRQLRGPLVLCDEQGAMLKHRAVLAGVRRAARRGKVQDSGVHVLRHTFCSHLSMRGAPVRAIQELAGHADLSTTQRYMHLSPAAIEGSIRLLDQASAGPSRGDIVETANGRLVSV